MGRWDRFRHIEGRRADGEPDKPEADTGPELERFREAVWDPTAPRNCLSCGADNNAVEHCYNCKAALDTPPMRAHQARHQQARLEREQRDREVERQFEAVKREAERTGSERRPWRRLPPRAPEQSFGGWLLERFRETPFWTLVRWMRRIENPWAQALAQLSVVGGFATLCVAVWTSPHGLAYLLVVAVLLGFRPWRWLRWGRRGLWF